MRVPSSTSVVRSFPSSHKQNTLRSWVKFDSLVQQGYVDLDGASLDIAGVAAVARYVIYTSVRSSKSLN